MDRLTRLLNPFDVFFVGLHCPLEILEQREALRGDRRIGDAKADFESTHSFGSYDLELDSTQTATDNARRLLRSWEARTGPSAFQKMFASLSG